jgi:MoxR-like ATPase
LPRIRGEHIAVQADFRIIFTSNPADYAGVHGSQDALLERMVTILLSGFDQDTEAGITQTHFGLPLAEVETVSPTDS